MGFENPQVADRRIRDVVEKLRQEMAGSKPLCK